MRGLYLFQYSHFVNFDLAVGADIGEYAARAAEIMKGKFFPDTPEIHAPFYSFFLAGLQKIGFNVVGIRIFQTLLNYFSWIALFIILLKKNVPEKIALIFLGLAMCLAPLIFHPAELISETLLLPLFTAVFFFLDTAEESKSPSSSLAALPAGIFSAFALLTHGMVSGFIVLETVYLLFRKKWAAAALFAAGVLLLTVPFLTAKSIHYKNISGIQGNTGFNIFLGNNPKADGLCYMRPGNTWRKSHIQAQKSAEKRQISTDRYWLEQVRDFWLRSPGKALWLYVKKIPLIFSAKEHIAGADGGFLYCRTDIMNWLRILTFPVFLFAFYGIYLLIRKEKNLFWPTPLILGTALFIMQILTVTSGRYRLLMFPAILYLAAVGAVHFNWKKLFPFVAGTALLSFLVTYSFLGKDKAEAAALLGQAHFIKGHYVPAEDLLLFAKKRFRDSSRIDNLLGNIAEKKGDLPLARAYYAEVTVREPYMPEGWMNLANVTPDPERAGKYFRRAFETSPRPTADLTFNYARFLYAVKRSSEAEKLLEKTFSLDPDHIMALNLKGVIAADKKDFQQAAKFFLRAATLKENEPGFWRNTAIMARMAGDRELENKAANKFFQLQKTPTKAKP